MDLNGPICEVIDNNVSVQSDTSVDGAPASKKKKVQTGWYLVKTFDNISDADEAVSLENTWRFLRKENGDHRRYRCKAQQCPAEIYLLIEVSSIVSIYHTESEHNHVALGLLSNFGISQEVRNDIDKCLSLYLRQNCIKKRLSEKYGTETPSNKKLASYINKQRRHKLLCENKPVKEKAAISLGELGKWLAENSKVPENEHEPYVITYSLNWGSAPSFCFAITTKYLLKFVTHAKNIMTDTTNKLLWQGYSVLIIGTTDKNNIFFPICLGVSTTESKHDFHMIFSNLKESAMSLHSLPMTPSVLLCDSSKSLQEAFSEVFGSEPVIRICWKHFKSDVKKKVEELVEIRYRKRLLEDLAYLQSAQTQEFFASGMESFLARYKKQSKFLTYFKSQWVDQNQNWYLGAAIGSPETNKTLSTFVKDFDEITNTSFEGVPLFLGMSAFRVKQWSQKRNLEHFSNIPTIELEDWKEAYKILEVDPIKPIFVSNSSDYKQYLFLCPPEVGASQNKEEDSFDKYKKKVLLLGYYFVLTSITAQMDRWMESSCTCVDFCRNFKCKHIIALAITLGYVSIPPKVRGKIVGGKRKREVSALIVP